MERFQLDKIDLMILQNLSENARTPLKNIAKAVGLSSPAVSARIARMEKKKIIEGYRVNINPELLGYSVKAFIMIDIQPGIKEEFYAYVAGISNILECCCVTGEYSMLLECMYATTEELDGLINHLHRFGKTKTMIAFSTAVEHRTIPIDQTFLSK